MSNLMCCRCYTCSDEVVETNAGELCYGCAQKHKAETKDRLECMFDDLEKGLREQGILKREETKNG